MLQVDGYIWKNLVAKDVEMTSAREEIVNGNSCTDCYYS